MFITNHQDFKKTVSNLRRELKVAAPESAPSHTQCMELMAKALGFKSYAELLPRLPVESTPRPMAQAPKYPLLNLEGELDLTQDKYGIVVTGRHFGAVRGTLDDILSCVCSATYASRDNNSGSFVPEHEGGTQVNWDGQTTRRNKDGFDIWETEGYGQVSAAECLLVPEWFDGPATEQALDLPNRLPLLEAYFELVQEQGRLAELHRQLKDHGLDSDLLAQLADTVGFALHRGELFSLDTFLRGRL